jgi:hypothetical protein
MSQPITINLRMRPKTPWTRRPMKGLSPKTALIEKALTDYLFLRQFRNLRERLRSTGKPRNDQDVFDLVS